MQTVQAQSLIEKKIKLNNEEIAYLDTEVGDTTLVFIHGAFINKEYWLDQIAYFSPSYRVVAMDLAGHGNSTHNRDAWTVEQNGKDINDLIQALRLKNVILVAHSAGSDVMLEAVTLSQSDIIGIVAVDNFKNLNFEFSPEMVDGLISELKNNFAGTSEYYASTQLMNAETPKPLADRLKAAFREMNPTIGTSLIESSFRYSSKEKQLLENVHFRLNLINVPYMATDEDALKQALGSNYHLSIIDGTCHYPMVEHPAEFNSLLKEILLTQIER